MVRWLVVLLCVALCRVAGAQEPPPESRQTPNTLGSASGAESPPATLADVHWLIGHWKGTGLGGVSEEIWAEPAGGVMMGMYRLVLKGKPSFYEFMHLAEDTGSLVLKLKHFNADLTAWEEKDRFVTFRLVRMTASEVFFSGLTFRRSGEDRLQIFLALRGSDGTVREERFELQRQK
jgi:hypothetical protein